VEGHEHHALSDPGDRQATSTAPRRDATRDQVAVGHAQALGVGGRQLDPGLGGGLLELGRPAGPGPGVEVVDAAAGGQQQRELLVGLLDPGW
jgi:hypothetical protein